MESRPEFFSTPFFCRLSISEKTSFSFLPCSSNGRGKKKKEWLHFSSREWGSVRDSAVHSVTEKNPPSLSPSVLHMAIRRKRRRRRE